MIHAFKSRVAVAVFAASSVFAANAAEITGAGASFIYPVMSKWSADYNAATSKQGQLPVDRFRRRHCADQGQDR